MQSNIDDYIYSPEDEVLSGEVEEGRTYTEKDFFNGNIIIKDRDRARVKEFMKYIGINEKTLVFCATQDHAAAIRDMINQKARTMGNTNPKFCVRVTANDGTQGELYLKEFQDNEKMIPTILTTSQKLSTGVDALNVRNIVLLRPVNSMIEFKQIIGRGTRLYDGKYYFTIYDFVKAYERFNDPTWDGEPICMKCGNNPCTCEKKYRNPKLCTVCGQSPCVCPTVCPNCGQDPCVCTPTPKPVPVEIRLSDGTKRNIQTMKTDMFWGADGKPVNIEEFINSMFGKLPEFFKNSEELHKLWANPISREELLSKLGESGYGKDILKEIRSLINADGCDLMDVLEYIEFNSTPIQRIDRALRTEEFRKSLTEKQNDFVDTLIQLYIKSGIDELSKDKLPALLQLKFQSVTEGIKAMGDIDQAQKTFFGFQKKLYN